MNAKTLTVHCTCSEENVDLKELIAQSFRIFLQKELHIVARPTGTVYPKQ